MAAERAQQDGYAARDRHLSDGNIAPNSTSQQHDQHHNSTSQQQPHHHHHHHHRPADAERDLFLRVEQLEQQISWNYSAIRNHEESLARFDRALVDFQQDVRRALDSLSGEIRSRATAPGFQGRYEPQDVEVLASQIGKVATKVHEIDNVKTQVELLKTKLKRLEADSASHTLQIPPRPSTASSFRDNHDTASHPPGPPSHAHGHQPLPPIHTGAPKHPAINISSRQHLDQASHPPPNATTFSGWRPGPQPPYANRPDPDSNATGWASVNNNNQGPKRPFDDPSPREHSAPASPKRPKLAPLKPRSAFGEEHPPYAGPDGVLYNRPDGAVPPQLLTTPASATAAPNSFRFITATTPSEGPEAWRGDDGTLTPASARGRGRTARGRARARGSRGENGLDGETSEWEQKSDWHAPPPQPQPQQLSPNGYYNSGAPRPLLRPGEGPPEYPLTPIASAVSPQDHSLMPGDAASSGKKTRTKPIRNSAGILIRKDGRPDMRSVSSANNLRKVHAKKEAEKAETDGRTPSLARSLAPAGSNGDSADDEQSEEPALNGSGSATPKTQADGERSEHHDGQDASAPTSASTDDATNDQKSAQGGWYSREEDKGSMVLDHHEKSEGEKQDMLSVNKTEVEAG
ncbi:hypothetical protein AMS68_003362 [Peltaster fructicola]|uniref:Uncharacterized protein n=1 Tax=Peltaster fructicola TaxID=286661 RepID=A0A6H0XT74_9PEZI|nr:hypothetical protein AMS68_003362 [Peltaster fructicola]